MATGDHHVVTGIDLLGGQVNIVARPVQDIIQVGRERFRDRCQGIARLDLVIDPIHRRNLEHLPNPQAIWGTF